MLSLRNAYHVVLKNEILKFKIMKLLVTLMSVSAVLFLTGCLISNNKLQKLASKNKSYCIFTGQIVDQQGYLYVCNDGNYTSHCTPKHGNNPKVKVKMYHVCSNNTRINNKKDVVCGYDKVLTQTIALLFTTIFIVVMLLFITCIIVTTDVLTLAIINRHLFHV